MMIVFPNHFVYLMRIKGTKFYYWGKSYYISEDGEKVNRFRKHKNSCFKLDYKVYRKMRELGITEDNFYDRVSFDIIFEVENNIDSGRIEALKINLDDPFCLNNQLGDNKTYSGEYRK